MKHYLKDAVDFNFLGEDSLAIASYNGHFVLGVVKTDEESNYAFLPNLSIQIKPNSFVNFTRALRLGLKAYEENPDEKFTLDLVKKGRKDPLYKMTASFSKQNSLSDPLFQIRRLWQFLADSRYHDDLDKGKQGPITPDHEGKYKWTKQGVILQAQDIEDILLVCARQLTHTYNKMDYTSRKKMLEFVQFGVSQYQDEICDFMNDYHSKKRKDKEELLEKMLLEMVKKNSKFIDDDGYKLKEIKDEYLEKEILIFSLFNLEIPQESIQYPTCRT